MTDKPISELAAATVETPEQPTSIEEQADRILQEASAPPAETPETGPQAESVPEKWTIRDIAERLNVDPAQLYNDLAVSLEDGTEVSVSAIKDSYLPATELAKAREYLTEEVTTAKREVAEAQQELGLLVQHLGGQASPELLREISKAGERQRSQQIEAVLQAVPEWKDPIRKAADWSDIRRAVREAGGSEAEARLAEIGFAPAWLVKLMLKAAKVAPAEKPKPQQKVAAAPRAAKEAGAAQRYGELKGLVRSGRMRPEEAAAKLLKGI